jgi:hypothetical protein
LESIRIRFNSLSTFWDLPVHQPSLWGRAVN